MSGNELVQMELQTFLQALASYPNRFAANPRISFEQYRSSLMAPPLPTQSQSNNGSARKN